MTTPLSHASYRLYPKRGPADCVIACMATIFRRDYEDVLIAAVGVNKHAWRSGLHTTEFARIARRLKVRAEWKVKPVLDEDTGVLWIGYHDSTREHCVVLLEGKVIDPDHDPVSLWDADDYLRANNAYANQLFRVRED